MCHLCIFCSEMSAHVFAHCQIRLFDFYCSVLGVLYIIYSGYNGLQKKLILGLQKLTELIYFHSSNCENSFCGKLTTQKICLSNLIDCHNHDNLVKTHHHHHYQILIVWPIFGLFLFSNIEFLLKCYLGRYNFNKIQKNELWLRVKARCPNLDFGFHWSSVSPLPKGELQSFLVKCTKNILHPKIMKTIIAQKFRILIFCSFISHFLLKGKLTTRAESDQFITKMLLEGASWQLTVKFDFLIFMNLSPLPYL